MRKIIALCMTCALLLISTMPTISLASICDMSEDHLMSQDMVTQSSQNDEDSRCVECGCGCHQSIDGLPHLLSPHLISQSSYFPTFNSMIVEELYLSPTYSYEPSVQLPPPDLS